ncbi:MAG: YgcG family protein [Betaproteobacteria bacterium]|nr:YgcG family protein [Betaproteobacteria bacterium]
MFFRLIGLLALALAGLVALTGATAADEVAIPPLAGAIVDRTATLSPEDLRGIDADLKAFAQRKGSQVAVLMVPSTKPEAIEQYSIRVADAWKIGRAKVDDGVIMVIAKDDRALRIEVGYGLEGAIPDAIAKRVISENIAPRFRAGDFAGGIRDGTATLMKLIEGEKLPAPAFVPSGSKQSSLWDLLVPLFVAAAIGTVMISMMGRLPGAALAGVGFGVAAWWIMGALLIAGVGALVAFLLVLANSTSGAGHYGGGSGGSWGGGSRSSNDSFSGGGGSFGGGGASGDW